MRLESESVEFTKSCLQWFYCGIRWHSKNLDIFCSTYLLQAPIIHLSLHQLKSFWTCGWNTHITTKCPQALWPAIIKLVWWSQHWNIPFSCFSTLMNISRLPHELTIVMNSWLGALFFLPKRTWPGHAWCLYFHVDGHRSNAMMLWAIVFGIYKHLWSAVFTPPIIQSIPSTQTI